MKILGLSLVLVGAFLSSAAKVEKKKSLCEMMAHDEGVQHVKTIELDGKPDVELKDVEKAMIQMSVLSSTGGQAYTPKEAVGIFTDTFDGRDGGLGGAISYFEVDGKTVAKATFYPGDNEYGLLFRIYKSYASQIGTVGDSDIYCLNYVEVD